MTATTIAPGQFTSGIPRPRWWQVTRWLTVVAHLAVLAVVALAGIEDSSYGNLKEGLQTGAVRQVRIEGAIGDAGGLRGVQGSALVRLVWRDGWRTRKAEVRQVTSESEEGSLSTSDARSDPDTEVVVGRVDTVLRQHATDVQLTWTDRQSGAYATVLGRELRGPWVAIPLAALILLIVVIAFGPDTRLATPWGWAWLAFTPLSVCVGLAYLLVGVRGVVSGRFRLTGGWAFLIAFVVLPVSALAT